jgi:hypothetical protein
MQHPRADLPAHPAYLSSMSNLALARRRERLLYKCEMSFPATGTDVSDREFRAIKIHSRDDNRSPIGRFPVSFVGIVEPINSCNAWQFAVLVREYRKGGPVNGKTR